MPVLWFSRWVIVNVVVWVQYRVEVTLKKEAFNSFEMMLMFTFRHMGFGTILRFCLGGGGGVNSQELCLQI
jgi:hypothetical protein